MRTHVHIITLKTPKQAPTQQQVRLLTLSLSNTMTFTSYMQYYTQSTKAMRHIAKLAAAITAPIMSYDRQRSGLASGHTHTHKH
jgi:hypothetical protein